MLLGLLKNFGEECWHVNFWDKGCEKDGKCAFCGPGGLCCRKERKVNECDGILGGPDKHLCVPKPSGNTLSCMLYFRNYKTKSFLFKLIGGMSSTFFRCLPYNGFGRNGDGFSDNIGPLTLAPIKLTTKCKEIKYVS